METLHCSGKGTPLREEARTERRERDGNKSERTSVHSTESAQVLCQSLFSSLICVSSHHRDQEPSVLGQIVIVVVVFALDRQQ